MSNSPSHLSIPSAGEPAPALTVSEMASSRLVGVDDLLDASDGPVLLYWIKTGCPTCRLAAPFVDRLAAQATARVCAISQDEPQIIEGFAADHGLESLSFLSESAPFESADAWGITTVPTWFWIERDASGAAIVRESGVMFSQAALQNQFETLGGSGALFKTEEHASLPPTQPG